MSTAMTPVHMGDVSTDLRTVTDRSMAVAPRPAATSMAELLYMAVEKGTPVAELKELVALHEHMSQRQAQQDFAAAMAAFQAECPSIKKSSTAKFTTRGGGEMSYTFAALDEIADTVNPILAKHGLSYNWDSTVTASSLTCVCTVRHCNGFSTSSSITLPTDSASAMSSQQKIGSALTFARRLSLTSALGLTTTDDDTDGRDVNVVNVTDEQAETLTALLEDVGADRARFLTYLGVSAFSELAASRYNDAVAALERKRAKS
ncbi:MAG: ERF family protein [Gemmatimonadota bacterium]